MALPKLKASTEISSPGVIRWPWLSRITKTQVPTMEVLYGTIPTYKAILMVGVPYISLTYSLYIGECLHFRYLKCWVIKHIFPGCEPFSFARTPLITNQDISNVCFPIHKAGFHIHRAFSSAKQKLGLPQSETMALVMSKKLS